MVYLLSFNRYEILFVNHIKKLIYNVIGLTCNLTIVELTMLINNHLKIKILIHFSNFDILYSLASLAKLVRQLTATQRSVVQIR